MEQAVGFKGDLWCGYGQYGSGCGSLWSMYWIAFTHKDALDYEMCLLKRDFIHSLICSSS